MTAYAKLVGAIDAHRALEQSRTWRSVGHIVSAASCVFSVGGFLTSAGPLASLIGLALSVAWIGCNLQRRALIREAQRWIDGEIA